MPSGPDLFRAAKFRIAPRQLRETTPDWALHFLVQLIPGASWARERSWSKAARRAATVIRVVGWMILFYVGLLWASEPDRSGISLVAAGLLVELAGTVTYALLWRSRFVPLVQMVLRRIGGLFAIFPLLSLDPGPAAVAAAFTIVWMICIQRLLLLALAATATILLVAGFLATVLDVHADAILWLAGMSFAFLALKAIEILVVSIVVRLHSDPSPKIKHRFRSHYFTIDDVRGMNGLLARDYIMGRMRDELKSGEPVIFYLENWDLQFEDAYGMVVQAVQAQNRKTEAKFALSDQTDIERDSRS